MVVIKSLNFSEARQKDEIVLFASDKRKESDSDLSPPSRFKISIPRIPKYFSGTGDLMAALILGHIALARDLKTACERSVATIQAILRRTLDSGSDELKLIQSKADIENPRIELKAEDYNAQANQ